MQKFTWTWRNGAYFVDQPGYDGGEMYLAADVDARIAELEQELAECNRLLGEAQSERGLGMGKPADEVKP